MTDSSALEAYVKRNEGLRLAAYDDATGHAVPVGSKARGTLTIGWGHTGADVIAGLVWTEHQAEDAIERDLSQATRRAVSIVGIDVWSRIGEARQIAIIDMAFNLGRDGLGAFHGMIAAIRVFDWQKAHDECMDSLYASQVQIRAERNARALLTGQLS